MFRETGDPIKRHCPDHGFDEWLWSSPRGSMSLQELCDLDEQIQTTEEMQWLVGTKRHLLHDHAPLPGDPSFKNFRYLDHIASCSGKSVLDSIQSSMMFRMVHCEARLVLRAVDACGRRAPYVHRLPRDFVPCGKCAPVKYHDKVLRMNHRRVLLTLCLLPSQRM